MDVVEKVRQLVRLMNQTDIAELEVEEPDLRIRLKTNSPMPYAPTAFATNAPPPPMVTAAVQPASVAESSGEGGKSAAQQGLVEIVAPMVGTFYRASSDGSEPYVSEGSEVEPDSIVCIVEAMKVMNEVKAEVSGEIVEVLVQYAEPVEYGQVLFLVRPGA